MCDSRGQAGASLYSTDQANRGILRTKTATYSAPVHTLFRAILPLHVNAGDYGRLGQRRRRRSVYEHVLVYMTECL
uniref:Uncharacterized protein n=1 Tax=Engystomops pustulosus TaxID=76066 RepID=A0AAV6YYF0_ENGPU|nr:hypothetical protein GDO81_030145 [Engystomops pustulosus]